MSDQGKANPSDEASREPVVPAQSGNEGVSSLAQRWMAQVVKFNADLSVPEPRFPRYDPQQIPGQMELPGMLEWDLRHTPDSPTYAYRHPSSASASTLPQDLLRELRKGR